MTETCSGISGFWLHEQPDKIQSAGKAFKGVDISQNNGYIAIKSPMNMKQYFKGDACGSTIITLDKGQLEDDFNLDYTTKMLFDDTDRTYNALSENDKQIVDDHISQNGFITCKTITKAESEKLGKREQSCNPLTKGMGADYIVIYVSGERFYVQGSDVPLYTLEGGGDESKKAWLAAIGGYPTSQIVQSDVITPTPYFLNESTLGNLIPFSVLKYVELNTGRTFNEYYDGLIAVYVKDIQ